MLGVALRWREKHPIQRGDKYSLSFHDMERGIELRPGSNADFTLKGMIKNYVQSFGPYSSLDHDGS